MVGCNFLPSNAINQLEMWQGETFDASTIDRELGWASNLGMNTVRVYLHDLVWSIDPVGFLRRIEHFLQIAEGHDIRVIFVFFDDCHFSEPRTGSQPEPIPGFHNSGWKQSPGEAVVLAFHEGTVSHSEVVRLQGYVQGVLRHFRDDPRIRLWDLYNEPGMRGLGARSLYLLETTWDWARAVDPSQPLTVGLEINYDPENGRCILTHSDLLSFHVYNDPDFTRKRIAEIRERDGEDRPLLCTEYMARDHGCTFQNHLPLFKEEGIGAINWGLVAGKSNTIWSWKARSDTRDPATIPDEPEVWFHDILRPDGSPYSEEEVALIRRLTDVSETTSPGSTGA